ncbi:MAG: dephospho-CoA kinase [Winkia neuii]|uniref:dephospho-CoA kinase n=1 Tax=Winkia neuii TaxID=33007 RepID=UPI0018D21A7E|nr:dephospho-CoA kinase [Winkia neuii]MDK8099464.1 dephospho-CoA kinase [Winkia neuii]MDU3135184.1 dephospho-CoA kinase [Winkia neuii]
MGSESPILFLDLPTDTGSGLQVAVSGGIGAGKSTVSAALASLGAKVVDADQISRELTSKSGLALPQLWEAFGPGVFTPDGALDRQQLAKLVFADPAARTELDRIMHPLINLRARDFLAQADPGQICVYDIPLLVETGFRAAVNVIVWAPTPVRIQRLVKRGLSATDARARIRAQATDAQRFAVANVVVNNAGERDKVEKAVATELWPALLERA